MAGVDKINTVNPTWRIDSQKERQKKKQRKPGRRDSGAPDKRRKRPGEDNTHIDEYA
jgi:hypothetical protein